MSAISAPNIANMPHHADMPLDGAHTFMALFGEFLCGDFWIVFNLPFNPCIKVIIYDPIRLSATLSATKPFCNPHDI